MSSCQVKAPSGICIPLLSYRPYYFCWLPTLLANFGNNFERILHFSFAFG